MIKRRAFTMFLIALTLGIGAAWLANQWLQNRLVASAEASTAVPVVVAALEIPFAHTIEATHLKTINWPAETVPEAVFHDTEEVVGKVANQKIYPGELLLKGRLVDQVAGSTLSAIVTPGMRAVTVRVNDVIGVAGFLLPGNRVDVIATRQDGDQRAHTETILQDLKVLAVDQTASPEKDKPVVVRAVTLEMTPMQAEELVKATEVGTVQLALRNPRDDSIIKEPVVVEAEPEPVKEKVVVIRRAAPRTDTVTVIRGTNVDITKTKL